MGIINEIKNLIKVGGGDPSNVNTIEQGVRKLSENSGGGSYQFVKLSQSTNQCTTTLGSSPQGTAGSYFYSVAFGGNFGESYESTTTLEDVIPSGKIIGFVAKNLAISSQMDGSDKVSLEDSTTQPPNGLCLAITGVSGFINATGSIKSKDIIANFDEIKEAKQFTACGSLYIAPWAQTTAFNGKYLWCDIYAIVLG